MALANVDTNRAELLAALVMARGMALPILPERKGVLLSAVWTDEVLANVAEHGAAVLAMHGIRMGDMLGRWAPYAMLLGAVAPPLLATRAVLAMPDPQPADVVEGDGARGQQ